MYWNPIRKRIRIRAVLLLAALVAGNVASLGSSHVSAASLGSFTQSSYRFYQNVNSLSTTLTPLAAQNTTTAIDTPNTPFRLRQLLSGVVTTAGGASLKLQYANNGATATCSLTFTGATYADVTSTSPISYYVNSTLANGQNITTMTGDPTDGVNVVLPENYVQSNSVAFTNGQNNITTGQDGEWDFALNDTSAAPGYYCLRIVNSDGTLLTAYSNIPTLRVVDQPPTVASGLSQTATSSIPNGNWINQTSVTFGGTGGDGDYTDSLSLCVELKPIATAYTNVETSCGTPVAYSGTPVAMTNTISSLTTNTQYHWQARIKDSGGNYSAWSSFGASPNFGVDTTPPATGSVYDGATVSVETNFNNGSLSQISANWTGFTDTSGSGIQNYSYSIGTTPGATDILASTNTASTTATVTGLSLRTSKIYYFNVKANDVAGNSSSSIASPGQMVAPSLSFSISPTTLAFGALGPNNAIPWTDTKATTLSATSNAYNGFVIRAYMPQLLSNGTKTIPAFNGGTYALPNAWGSGDTGFGYTSSATTVQGVNKFQASPCPGGVVFSSPGCYAPYASTAPGDIVADQAGGVVGVPVSASFTITNRVTVSPTQSAAPYSGIIVYSLTASF